MNDVLTYAQDRDGPHVTLDIGSNGRVFARSQTRDYALRGPELESYSVWQFIKDTYEVDMTAADRRAAANPEDSRRGPGRPQNERSMYLDAHPCHGKKVWVVRSRGHRNIPNVIGKWFPRSNDDESRAYYSASMLMLLKPWRRIDRDLKPVGVSWADAFAQFRQGADREVLAVIGGIQYFHECSLVAAERREEENGGQMDRSAANYTEEGLRLAKLAAVNMAEYAHALLALEAARQAKFFSDSSHTSWTVTEKGDVRHATGASLIQLSGWKAQMDKIIEDQHQAHLQLHVPVGGGQGSSSGDVQHEDGRQPLNVPPVVEAELPAARDALPAMEVSELTDDQFRAYNIIAWHLEQTLAGTAVAPLRMVIYGEGGTGKSRMIQTVTEMFARHDATFMLVKAAYTGIAASLIDGKTMHTIAHLSLDANGNMSDETKRQLQVYWRPRRYLVLDEYSMLAKTFLARFERTLSIAMQGSGLDGTYSFGGLSVILCGDLHQFPPVAKGPPEWLFCKRDEESDTPEQQLGHRLYEEFTTVVILRQQMRVTDPEWRDFLDHLRHGQVQPRHLDMLRELVVGEPGLGDGSFDGSKWNNAALVTPRHAVRTLWNTHAVRTMCKNRGRQVYVVTAADLVQGCPLRMKER